LKKYTTKSGVIDFILEHVNLCQPSSVMVSTGSDEERISLEKELIKEGTFIPLNPKIRPNSFLARSHPSDVARMEDRTFICSIDKINAGPTNNWKEPGATRKELSTLFSGCMKGRVMYIIPFAMGHVQSSLAQGGIEITDSAYVVLNMRIMTHMGGEGVWDLINRKDFVRCVHSVGVPLPMDPTLKELGVTESWPCNPSKVIVSHFPETREVYSFGSGYGGNALLGKKCLALRIASTMGRDAQWLAEHMLILGITNPEGEKKYIVGSLPSACGKTNLAMLTPTLPGWKVEVVGDDIAWMKFHSNGRLYAINPETGFFGVAPGTSMKTNPNAIKALTQNTIFTNVGLTPDGDVWWEGLTKNIPDGVIDWKGNLWTPESKNTVAHPNSRFTAPASQSPVIDPNWQDPKGVPIDAILFGGRPSTTVPLVYESRNWNHGVFLGAIMSSETTAAAIGQVGKLRHDPFAMLPFCGYHMGDYFNHWLEVGLQQKPKGHLPRFYYVNWFRKDSEGNWLWPGFGDNIRVLKWMFERSSGTADAIETPIGFIPTEKSLDLSGLDIKPEKLSELLKVDKEAWKKEVEDIQKYLDSLGQEKVPKNIWEEVDILTHNLEEKSHHTLLE